MANYCSNCGTAVDASASFCPNCGTALNGGAANTNTNANNAGSGLGTVLGTLVAVSLIGGLTRQLYYYNGRYFLDPYCRRPFMSPHLILGRHRPFMRGFHRGPMMGGPRGPMGGPRGPMGGPRGPMGGPRGPMGGGPRGGHR